MHLFKKELNFTLVVVILAIAAIIVVGATGYYTFKLSKETEESSKEIVTIEPRIEKEKPVEETPEEIVPGEIAPKEIVVSEGHISLTENKILFTEKGNIFMMDEFGKITQILKCTGEYPGHAKERLQIINDEHLGYYRCDVKTGDFNCGIYRINIASEQPEKLIRADKDVFMGALDFYSKDIFAYNANFREGEPWTPSWIHYGRIYLYKEGKESVIKEIDFIDYLGDKYTIEAGMTDLIFSPDGTKILLGIARIGGYTESIRVFDLYGKELAKIEKAAEPDWIDEKTIIFGRYRDLCSFDISSKKEKCYGIDRLAYNPKVLRGFQKVAYWVDEKNIGSVWILDLKLGKSEKLLDNAFRPLWISQEKLLVAKTQKFPEGEELFMSFRAAPLSIFNIFTREAFDIEGIEKGWHYFTTSLSNEGYDYYLK